MAPIASLRTSDSPSKNYWIDWRRFPVDIEKGENWRYLTKDDVDIYLSRIYDFLVYERSAIKPICLIPPELGIRPGSSSELIFPSISPKIGNTTMGTYSIEALIRFVPLLNRLESLSQLQDGWIDGEGKSFNRDELDWLKLAFISSYSKNLPIPYIYPTPDGCIRAEWTVNSNEISLEINLATRNGEWHSLNFDTAQDYSETIDLAVLQGWSRLAELISHNLNTIA